VHIAPLRPQDLNIDTVAPLVPYVPAAYQDTNIHESHLESVLRCLDRILSCILSLVIPGTRDKQGKRESCRAKDAPITRRATPAAFPFFFHVLNGNEMCICILWLTWKPQGWPTTV
jgi:hypothetical protein